MPAHPATAAAHKHIRRVVLDPDYGEPTNTDPRAPEASWMYAFGDLEAWLLARLRHDGMHDCRHVFHPGLFRSWSPYVSFTRTFSLAAVPKRAVATLVATGRVRFLLNGRALARADATSGLRLDLRPMLRVGNNDLKVLVTALTAPAALRWTSTVIAADAAWHASRDDIHHDQPAVLVAESDGRPPHEPAPRLRRLRSRRRPDGVLDFGVEAVGRMEVTVRGRGTVTITPGESVSEALAVAPPDNSDALDHPITRARVSGTSTLTTLPVAARYARVDVTGSARLAGASMLAEYEPLIWRGAFACSDELLTRAWTTSAYTLRLCVRDGLLIDGPKRDRMPWVGDAFLAALCGAYAFGDAGPVRRTLIALTPADPAACHANGIIDYSLYWLLALDAHRLNADEPAEVARLWPDAKRILAALATQEDAHGFLRKRDGDWLFIDWADLDKLGAVPALQWLYVWALRAGAATATTVGDRDAAKILAARHRRLTGAIESRLWDATRGCYAESGHRPSRHAQFLAVLAGAPSARRAALTRTLAGDELPPVGTPWMRTLELAALANLGRIDATLAGVRSTWGGMLATGATTFWEAWDATQTGDERYAFYDRPFGKSLCHAWSAGPAWLLPSAILGIRPLATGWRRAEVRPVRSDLSWAYATVPTPHGPLHVEFERGKLRVRAPKGIEVVKGG